MEKKGFSEEDYRFYHPGGALGKKMLKVKHLMHTGDQMPVVGFQAAMKDVIRVIDEKKFGVTVVINDRQEVAGIITDGDLRRMLLKGVDFSGARAADCMTLNPLSIGAENLAVEALRILEEKAITSLIVKNGQNQLLGLLHLHDLWRTEMI